MKETLKKSPDSAEQQTTQRYYENKNYYSNHDRRGLKAGIGVLAAGAVLIAGGYGVSKFNAEAEPAPGTSTEDVIDHDPTGEDPTEIVSETPEVLTLDNFPFVVNGEQYDGIKAFEEAFTIQATPANEYPGTFMSEERDIALQAEIDAAVDQWMSLANNLVNYEFTDEQREQYADFEYTNQNGDLYIGTDAVRAQLIGEAFREVMTAESAYGDPYPQEFIDELIHLSVVADWEKQRTIENGETPYEIELRAVSGTDEIGGTELVDGFVAFGTIQIEVVTNQGEGNTATFDLTGFREIDCVNSTEPVVWQLGFENMQQEDGTAVWKATRVIVFDTDGNVVCGNLPQ